MFHFPIKKFLLTILSLAIFFYVINYLPYPTSWQEATTFQILAFFLPLLFFATFLLNFLIYSLARSFALGLGILVLLVLYSQNQLTIISFLLTIIFFGLLAWKMPEYRFKRDAGKIPKLQKFKNT